MLKQFRRQVISIALVLALTVSMFSITAGALKTENTLDEIELAYDNGVVLMSGSTIDDDEAETPAELTYNEDDNEVTISANSYGENCGSSIAYSAGVTTIHVQVLDPAQMTFAYTYTGGGTVVVSKTADGAEEIAPVGSRYYTGLDDFYIIITTIKGEKKRTELVLSDITLNEETDWNVTVQGASGGTVTVNDETSLANGDEFSNTVLNTGTINFSATPNKGYAFAGYYMNDDTTAFTDDADFAFTPSEDVTIKPKFVSTSSPSFMVGGVMSGYSLCSSFSDAVQYATDNHSEVIIPLADFEINSSATIPSGTTLLIPNSDQHTIYTIKPNVVTKKETHKLFLKATVKSGATLSFAEGSALSLAGNLFSPGGGKQAEVTGAYGQLVVEDGASVVLNNNCSLYAWGFATGAGTIVCNDGVTVYESFQIEDFAGGSISANIAGSVFPFSQYYIQNVECKLKMYAGAEEVVFGALDAAGATYDCSLVFIGGDGSMFNIADGYILKYYDYEQDKLICEIHGDSSIDTIMANLPYLGATNTERFQMPINNIGVELAEGNLTINQDLMLLPDSYVVIDEGASVDIKSDVFLISDKDWEGQNRVYPTLNRRPLPFSATIYDADPSSKGASSRATKGDMESAKMELNGTMTISGSGTFNMTASGADFSGTGTVINNSTVKPTTDTQIKLVNFSDADNRVQPESTDTECNRFKGENYHYNAEFDKWTSRDTVSVTFKGKNPNSTSTSNVNLVQLNGVPFGTETGVTDATTKSYYYLSTYSYLFQGWQDGTNKKIYNSDADNIRHAFDDGTTYTAQYLRYKNQYVVNFVDRDGSELATITNQKYNEAAAYSGETPADYTEDGVSYSFIGWKSSVDDQVYTDLPTELLPTDVIDITDPVIASDRNYIATVTYTATYANVNTITWKNDDGTVLKTDHVPTGETPVYGEEDPTKPASGGVTYTFAGWDPEVVPADGNATYTATYTANYFRAHSLSLLGQISANFYWNIPEGEDYTDYSVVFTFMGQETAPVTLSKNDNGYYAALAVNAPELTCDITATLMHEGSAVDSDTFKAAEYGTKLFGLDKTLTPGNYYVVGTIGGQDCWLGNIQAKYELIRNTKNTDYEEYMLTDVEFNAGDSIKVVKYNGDEAAVWYPDNTPNCSVNEAGTYTIYFRPNGNGFEDWFYSTIKLDKQESSLKNLIRATMNYGAKAQNVFGINVDDPADGTDYIETKDIFGDVTQQMINDKIGSAQPQIKENVFDSYGLEYIGSSLVMNANTKIKLYFGIKDADKYAQYKDSFMFGDHAVEPKQSSSDTIYFELSGIEAANLDTRYTLYNTADNSKTVQYAALDYVSLCLGDGTPLEELCKALYWYNVYADAYFG